MKNLSLRDILAKVHLQHPSQTRASGEISSANSNRSPPNKVLGVIEEVIDENANQPDHEILQVANDAPEHRQQIPLVASDCSEELGHLILPERRYQSGKNNMLVNSNNTNINPITVVFNHRSKSSKLSPKERFLHLSSPTRLCFLAFLFLLTFIAILVSMNTVYIFRLKNFTAQSMSSKDLTEHFKALEANIDQLHQIFNDRQNFTYGDTCSCPQICKGLGYSRSACANGSQCICKNTYISIEEIRKSCSCHRWCQEHGHKNGGFCGDGNTCICSRKI